MSLAVAEDQPISGQLGEELLAAKQSLESKQWGIWVSLLVLQLWVHIREVCSLIADKVEDFLIKIATDKGKTALETSILSQRQISPTEQPLSSLPTITTTPERVSEDISRHRRKANDWLDMIDEVNAKLFNPTPQKASRRPIRIAILDTGYGKDAILSHRITGWKDWVDRSENLQDNDGHGTHLASLMMRTAPEAEIYAARITNDSDGIHLAIENIIKAIDFAASDWEVDIISMSFGFEDHQDRISNTIRNAVNQRNGFIIFFAAAANSGANKGEMFPACDGNVISIRGTDSDGKFQSFNPPRRLRDGVVFGTLGVEVPAASISPTGSFAYKGGTSVATAIAVGMAAMMLGYVEGNSSRSHYQKVRDRLRTREGMLAMFECLACNSLDDGYWYLRPWILRKLDYEERWALFVVAASGIL